MFASLGILVFAVVFIICEKADYLGAKLGVVDRPDRNLKSHKKPTPLIGGLALLVPLTALLVMGTAETPNYAPFFVTLAVVAFSFWLLGFLDDRHNLPPTYRLVVSVAVLVVAGVIEPRFRLDWLDFDAIGYIDLGVFALPFSVLCIAALMNAVNMSDGRNGIVLGMATFWLYGLSQYAPPELIKVMNALVVCAAIVFVYNWSGKLFLGDSGTYLIGATVGLLTIYMHSHPEASLPESAGILWFIVPVLDCARLAITRMARGRSPFKGDDRHFHHYLNRRLSWRRAYPIYFSVAAGPGFIGLMVPWMFLPMLLITPVVYGLVILWAKSGTRGLAGEDGMPDTADGRRLLFIVNDTRFFVSHRLSLAIGAIENGYDVHLAAFDNGDVETLNRHGIRLHRLAIDRTGLNPVKDLRFFRNLAKVMRRVRPDLVHCVTIKPVVYGGILSRLLRVEGCVMALSGLGQLFQKSDGSWKIRLARLAAKKLCRLAMGHKNGHVIFQNSRDLEEFVGAGVVPSSHTTLIPGSGVDPRIYDAASAPDETPTVILPARMLWSKGIQQFVDAAAAIRDRGHDVRFWLAGEVPEHNPDAVPAWKLRAWHDQGLVSWLGFCDDMPSLYARSSIVCLPTYYREGVPKCLIEAAACQRPIVTTDIPGCRDICRHEENGLQVPPRDVSAIVDAITALLKKPERCREMGERGRQLVEREFHIDRVVRETLLIYRRLQKDIDPSSKSDSSLPATRPI